MLSLLYDMGNVYLAMGDEGAGAQDLRRALRHQLQLPRRRREARRAPSLTRTITLIPGDGIGPEVTAATVRVIEAAGADSSGSAHSAGSEALARQGDPLPQETLDSIVRNGVALKGPITTPVGKGFRSVNVALRKALDLYANLRPVRSLPGVPARFDDVDLVVVRENTEGLYSGIEHVVVPGVVESLKIITEGASLRIARFAFEYAREQRPQAGDRRPQGQHHEALRRPLPRLLPEGGGPSTPTIATTSSSSTTCACSSWSTRTSSTCSSARTSTATSSPTSWRAWSAGSASCPGANIGEKAAVFEAVHGTAPDIAGRNLANPLALILSGVLMLHHLGESEPAARIELAITRVVSEQRLLTRDLGGTCTTTELTEALVREIKAG